MISNHSINYIIPLEIQHQWLWNLIWSRVGTSFLFSFLPFCLPFSFSQKLKLLFYYQLCSWFVFNAPPRHNQNCLTSRQHYTKPVLTGPLQTEVPGRWDTKPEDADTPHCFLSTSLSFLRTLKCPPSSQGQGCSILGCRCHRWSRTAGNLEDLAIYLGGYITSISKACKTYFPLRPFTAKDIHTRFVAEDSSTQLPKEERMVK